jgi:hypothetical protein
MRTLRPDGMLCLAGITPGVGPLSRLVMGIWQWVFLRNPKLVGVCRPSLVVKSLPAEAWNIRFSTVVVAWGVVSEVVIASPLPR